jgi:uncharacterized protein YjdB
VHIKKRLTYYITAIIFLLSFAGTHRLSGQVSAVHFHLAYNADSCRFEAYMIVSNGNAEDAEDRLLSVLDFTVILPSGTFVDNITGFTPLLANISGSGTEAAEWGISYAVNAPDADPSNDYYLFSPYFDEALYFNTLNPGDTVLLFSFTADNITNCGAGIRCFDNQSDPGPAAEGMGNVDFSNKISLNNSDPLFQGSNQVTAFQKPQFSELPNVGCNKGIEINLTVTGSNCQMPLSYLWTGPNGFISTQEDVFLQNTTTNNTGNYKVVVTDAFGCVDSLTVFARNKPNAGTDQLLCGGAVTTVQGTQPATGVWTVSDINSSGITLGLTSGGMALVELETGASGNYGLIYTYESCSDTMFITVNSNPGVGYSGPDELCAGEVTTLNPVTGGYWTSSNPGVATVNNSGQVISLTAGNVTFTYTAFASGCSTVTTPLQVNPVPATSIIGTSEVCVGSSTQLSPTLDGIWQSCNPAVASITENGLVTGLTQGQACFLFTDTSTGCISDTLWIMVRPVPSASIDGVQQICTGGTTLLHPDSGGYWTATNPDIAIASENGLVTGLTAGNTRFFWTETTTGCTSDTTDFITVLTPPAVQLPTNMICSGNSVLLSPNTGGTWTSSNPAIASVGSINGLVSGLSPGKAVFNFNSQATGCSAVTDSLTVSPNPEVYSDFSQLCVGGTTLLYPANSGVWTSLDPDIVFISGNLAIGLSPGFVLLNYTDNATGCQNQLFLPVNDRVTASFTDDSAICIGENTFLSPSTGGSWTSSNSAIATVNNDGMVTGISQGTVFFTFTEYATGCNTLPTPLMTIHPNPVVSLSGSEFICIGGNTQALPESGGIWQSNQVPVAEISSSGLITAISSGFADFTFTNEVTGCSATTDQVYVFDNIQASIQGASVVCVGGTTTLFPTSGGAWTSSDSTVAIVSENGVVTATGTGKVVFSYTETFYGCGYVSFTDTLTVTACFNPDFNVTTINTLVTGNISTNDQNSHNNIYSETPLLLWAPAGSNPVISMNGDGSYTFISDIPGRYEFEIVICAPPLAENCPTSGLIIYVTDDFTPGSTVIANPDLATMVKGNPIDIEILANDACAAVGGCFLDMASLQITVPPASGTAQINYLTGVMSYVPDQHFTGLITIEYLICASGTPTNCAEAKVIITVVGISTDSMIVASDDFFTLQKAETLSGNVLNNDFTTGVSGIYVVPIHQNIPEGIINLSIDGSFSFVPNPDFAGPVNFVYRACLVAADSLCSEATVYLLIHDELSINIRVYLEGSLMNNGNASAGGRPLMRDNLRVSPFNGSNHIPVSDPYSHPTDYVQISGKYLKSGPGLRSDLQQIPNPAAVMAVSGRDAIVDWIFVQLRSKNNPSQILATRSGLLQRDGDIVDLDGISPLRFPGVPIDDYFVAVKHRNHLGVMTQTPRTITQLRQTIDFTTPLTATFDFGTTKGNGFDYNGLAQNNSVKTGYMAMWAGDFDANNKIKGENPNDDTNNLFFEVFIFPDNLTSNANFDFAIGYFQGDFDMNSKSKFDNPNDDKNMLVAQVLFYPLNFNLLSNFDFIIEQLP